jgi:hypothetical protein
MTRHLTHAALALTLVLTTFGGTALAYAQHLADGKVMTIRLDTTARVFDMSPPGSVAPPGWTAPNFDDSSWDHAVAIKQNCRSAAVTNSAVWGPNNADMYLLRQTFMVPKASSYYGSALAYTATASLTKLAVNGNALHPYVVDRGLLAVAQYLHPGRNVVTGVLESGECSLVEDSITLRMTGLQRPNAVALSWHSVPGAARYYLQVWLVKAAPGQTITPDSQVNVAAQTTGLYYVLDAAAMPAGTYLWRTTAVNAYGALISRWTPAQTVTLD